nr:PREDICTED: uncharacterized protein LOC100560400 isoform X1 [Anolis carolinensis]|eukprot:XP_016852705.1 PREDICTED: uncharacterized protein LOC100560400 isoform X1 [Anolis carolinensis]
MVWCLMFYSPWHLSPGVSPPNLRLSLSPERDVTFFALGGSIFSRLSLSPSPHRSPAQRPKGSPKSSVGPSCKVFTGSCTPLPCTMGTSVAASKKTALSNKHRRSRRGPGRHTGRGTRHKKPGSHVPEKRAKRKEIPRRWRSNPQNRCQMCVHRELRRRRKEEQHPESGKGESSRR